MTLPVFNNPVVTAESATALVRQWARRKRGEGLSFPEAMREIARASGLGFWTISHLRKGNAKTCDVGTFAKIRLAYLDWCQGQATALQHELFIQRTQDCGDDLDDLENEISALAEKIEARRAALTLSSRRKSDT